MKSIAALSLVLVSLPAISQSDAGARIEALERRVIVSVATLAEPHAHGMRARGQSVEEARTDINLWIRFNMQRALELKGRGDIDGALFQFFLARHALRAATSPAANDVNGDPAVFDGKPPAPLLESRGGAWRDRVDEDMRKMYEIGNVPGGDLLKLYGIDAEAGPVERPGQLPRPKLTR